MLGFLKQITAFPQIISTTFILFISSFFIYKFIKEKTNTDEKNYWNKYNHISFKKTKIRSVKIIYKIADESNPKMFLAIKKRAKNLLKKKHKHWEFPGGQVENKRPIKSLKSELLEEDPTGILCSAFIEALENKRPLLYKLVYLKKHKKPDLIFLSNLKKEEWIKLNSGQKKRLKNHEEVMKYLLIPDRYFDYKQTKSTKWTPRSKKILNELLL